MHGMCMVSTREENCPSGLAEAHASAFPFPLGSNPLPDAVRRNRPDDALLMGKLVET